MYGNIYNLKENYVQEQKAIHIKIKFLGASANWVSFQLKLICIINRYPIIYSTLWYEICLKCSKG